MAKKATGTVAAIGGLRREGERLVRQLRKDGKAMLVRGQAQVAKDLRVLRRRADRAGRDLESSLLRRVHAASEAQLRKVERRMAALEKRVAQLEAAGSPAARGAA